MRKMDADIIVVAAGLSGLAAAISAAEKGASVIALEKSNITGGAANMGMGPLGIGSRVQKEHMVELTPGEAFRKHMFYTKQCPWAGYVAPRTDCQSQKAW